jgi:branched-chain amino acid transport system substrate-binding protein
MIVRRSAFAMLAAAAALALAPAAARAQFPNNTVKVGVLTDMSGPFSDQVGRGSVMAAQMAAEDFNAETKAAGGNGPVAEIIFGDHQNKPDIGVNIARQWVDQENVAAIVDLPNSGVALAVSNLMREKHRVTLASGSATSDLTGKACAPTTVQWVMDTWAEGNGTARALMADKLDTWFFLTVDYALGQALERDASAALTGLGGKVLGAVRSPLGTTDFSSPLLQAQASGAKVVVLANTGADAVNAVKQAGEFGIGKNGTQLAALFMQVTDIHSIGLPAAQGLGLVTGFYWDMNDDTRAFAKRFSARMGGRMPTEDQAGAYAATLHYLHAIRGTPTMDGEAAVTAMKKLAPDDKLFGSTEVRADGRVIHPMSLFRVKTPAESKGEWDLYTLVSTIPADKAFRPLAEGGCAFVKAR